MTRSRSGASSSYSARASRDCEKDAHTLIYQGGRGTEEKEGEKINVNNFALNGGVRSSKRSSPCLTIFRPGDIPAYY